MPETADRQKKKNEGRPNVQTHGKRSLQNSLTSTAAILSPATSTLTNYPPLSNWMMIGLLRPQGATIAKDREPPPQQVGIERSFWRKATSFGALAGTTNTWFGKVRYSRSPAPHLTRDQS